MSHETTYYWKIVAWDEHGASSQGPIWDFTTKSNNPPNTPSNPDPSDGEINVDLDANLSWYCSDPDGDELTYDVFFGTSSPPPLVSSGQSETTYEPGTMDHGTTYYWRIKAWDAYGASTLGPIWDFTTESNDPPNTPSNPDPEDGETGVGLNDDLSWTGGDPNGDSVTYDVYFGTSSPPPKVSSNQSETDYNPGTMNHGTKYYWKIVAWDEHGASSQGPIWDFTTEVNNPPNTPSNPDPSDGETGVGLDDDLSWSCSDPNGDNLTYDVYFGTSSDPPLVSSNQTGTSYNPGTMQLSTTYYWKIKAWDEHGSSTLGPIWDFTTRDNNPPNTPSNPDPEDGETDVDLDAILSWTGGDPDGDNVTYDVYFGDTYPPPQVSWDQDETTYDPDLEHITLYYWKIVAEDEFEETSEGPDWSFTTEGNNPPNIPYSPSPADGETDVELNADLSWLGGDPDEGDTVVYDIYFGDSSPPPLVKLAHDTTTFDQGDMSELTTYYWQIIARDNHDAETEGPIWSFTTGEELNFPPSTPSLRSLDHTGAIIIIKPGVNYEFEIASIDSNDDQVFYYVEWGDGETENWIGPYPSGQPVVVNHTWKKGITYGFIRAQAKDEHGAESGWVQLFYVVPRNANEKNPVILTLLNRFLGRFLEKHPRLEAFLFKILENIMSRFGRTIDSNLQTDKLKV
jgi:hypothetical protein